MTELLRYQVEIDHGQMEGHLSRLRNAIGSTIGAGVDVGGRAFNSMQSDLIAGRQFISNLDASSTSLQLSRAAVGGALEAGVAGASVGIPLTAGALYAFGAEATGAGIASGLQWAGSGIAGNITTAARMAPGLAKAGMTLGVEALGGIASLAVNPMAWGVAATAASAYAVASVGEGVIEDFRATADVEDMARAGGMSAGRARSFGNRAVQMMRGSSMRMSGAETAAIMETGLSAGMFTPAHMRDPDKAAERLKETAQAVRTLTNVLDTSLEEAMGILGQANASGMGPAQVTRSVLTAGALGAESGLGGAAMMQAGRMGANLATNMGISASTGANIAMQSLSAGQFGLGALSATQRRMVGGAAGMQQVAMRGTMMNAQMAGAMAIDPGGLDAMMAGEASFEQGILAAGSNLARRGPGGLFKGLLAMDEAQEDLTSADLRSMQIMKMGRIMKTLPPGMGAEERRIAAAGLANGIDMSTRKGRAQARAMSEAMSPEAVVRRINELQARQRSVMEESRGLGPAISRIGASAYDSIIGTSTRMVSGAVNDTMLDLRQRTDVETTRAGRWLRSSLRGVAEQETNAYGMAYLGQKVVKDFVIPNMVKSEAEEVFTFGLPTAMGDPDIVEAQIKAATIMGGKAFHEQIAGELKSRNLLKTEEQREREASVTRATNAVKRTKKSQKKAYSNAVSMLTTGKSATKIMDELKGKTREEQVDIVLNNMQLETGVQKNVNVAVAALTELDVEAEASGNEYEMGLFMEEKRDAISSGLKAIGGFAGYEVDLLGLKGAEHMAKTAAANIVTSVGSDTQQQASAAIALQSFLQAEAGEEEVTLGDELSKVVGKEMLQKARDIKREGTNVVAVNAMLDSAAKPARDLVGAAAANKFGLKALQDESSRVIRQLGDVVNVGGDTNRAQNRLAGSVRPEDQASAEAMKQLGAAIMEERMILQQIMKRLNVPNNFSDSTKTGGRKG